MSTDEMPDMAVIEELANAARTPEERILDAIERASEKLGEAEGQLWEIANEDVSYEGVKQWHEQAIALANATTAYAAEIKRLLDHISAAEAV